MKRLLAFLFGTRRRAVCQRCHCARGYGFRHPVYCEQPCEVQALKAKSDARAERVNEAIERGRFLASK